MKIIKLNKIHSTIRNYKPTDKKYLIGIFIQNTPLYFDVIEQENFEAYLKMHCKTYFVIKNNKKIAGGGGYHISEDETVGNISWNLIHPDHKGMGLGCKIVSYCLGILKETGPLKLIRVCTSQFAYKFYGKFGFEIVEIKKDFWAPGLDLYKMEMYA